MAKLQLSLSKTITIDTNDWGQDGRDVFAAALEKVGWRRDNGMTPSTKMVEDAGRALLENDDVFWDSHIDLSNVDVKDFKIVCVDRNFEPYEDGKAPMPSLTSRLEEQKNAKPQVQGDAQVAPKQEAAKGTTTSQAGSPSDKGKAEEPKPGQTTNPAPKIDDSKSGPITGARDSTQKK